MREVSERRPVPEREQEREAPDDHEERDPDVDAEVSAPGETRERERRESHVADRGPRRIRGVEPREHEPRDLADRQRAPEEVPLRELAADRQRHELQQRYDQHRRERGPEPPASRDQPEPRSGAALRAPHDRVRDGERRGVHHESRVPGEDREGDRARGQRHRPGGGSRAQVLEPEQDRRAPGRRVHDVRMPHVHDDESAERVRRAREPRGGRGPRPAEHVPVHEEPAERVAEEHEEVPGAGDPREQQGGGVPRHPLGIREGGGPPENPGIPDAVRRLVPGDELVHSVRGGEESPPEQHRREERAGQREKAADAQHERHI